MSAVDDIRIKVSDRLHVVEEEIESLRSALSALDAQERAEAAGESRDSGRREAHAPASAARSRRTAHSSGSRSSGRRRGAASTDSFEPAADASRAEDVEKLLAAAGGPEAVQLARQSGIDPAEVLARINELERAGRSSS